MRFAIKFNLKRLFPAACIFLTGAVGLQAQEVGRRSDNAPATASSSRSVQHQGSPDLVQTVEDYTPENDSSENGDSLTPATPVSFGYLQEPAGRPVQNSTPDQQVPFSGLTPFQISPTAQPVGNSQNSFSGNAPVQDMSRFMPGNFENTKYRWYGFVRLDGIFDANPIKTTDSFVTSSIPIPQGRGQNAVLTPRYTRLGFDTETPLKEMDWTIKTRIELDFFNGNTSGAFGSFPLRMRFAWVDVGPFLIGQAASLFMDYDVFPNVLDYQGPPGMVLMRQPIAAMRLPLTERVKLSMGVEQPYTDIQWLDGADWITSPGTGFDTTAGVARNVQDVPDLTGNLRYSGTYGHMQIAGIGRFLTYQPEVGSDVDEFGYGVNLTGTWHPWAHICCSRMCKEKSPLEKSRFLWQYAAGEGINRYLQDENGLGLDATFDPTNGFQLIPSTGWFVAYEQWWAKKWASNFSYGETISDLTDTLPDNTFESSTYASANLVWFPFPRMGAGAEYLYGTRENKDGQSGAANRIQLAFQYKF